MFKKVIMCCFFLVSGCSFSGNMEKDWTCNAPQGKGCTSIEEADQHDPITDIKTDKKANYVTETYSTEFSDTPLRSEEEIALIYFPAHIDKKTGFYIDVSRIYAVMKESSWKKDK